MSDTKSKLVNALWRIYNRPERPLPWAYGGNLPWDDPTFSQRMLQEHLTQSHDAATRKEDARQLQIEWLWTMLDLQKNQHLFDVTCGPGLYAIPFAEKGLHVTGIDFGPAAIAYAREMLAKTAVSTTVTFHQEDIRQMDFAGANFDAAMLIYGQLAVMTKNEAQDVLARIYQALRPGGRVAIELLNQDKIDKTNSNWWYSSDDRLWGDAPYLHLGERFWDEETAASIERFQTLHLDTGQLDEIHLCDQSYAEEEMVRMIRQAGFTAVTTHPAWDNLPLYDADEWIVYIGEK